MIGRLASTCHALAVAGAESWDGISSQAGGSSDRGSDGQASTLTTGRRGMFAALRIEDLGVIGEKGTKVCTVCATHVMLAASSWVRCVCNDACIGTAGSPHVENDSEDYQAQLWMRAVWHRFPT